MKVQRSISVDERLSNRVSELAAVEERSFSAMWGVLVGEALAYRNGEPDLPAAPVPASVESSGQVLARPTTRQRTKTCVHRVPPEAFCRFGCDG